MAKEDLLPFKYDSKTNTVFNTSGAKIVPVVRTKPRSKSWLNTFFDLSTRLAAWYVLYMIFYACPPDARVDPSAPAVCQRFDTMKHSALPYLKPYYDTYAEPYLAQAQPYLSKGQGYYEQFGAPTVAKGQDLWVKQASPRIKTGYSAVQDQYTQKVYPVLDRAVLQRSRDVYSKYLDSHVQTLSEQYTKSVHPHFQTVQKRSVQLYNERLVPAYETTAPRIQHAFHTVESTYAKQVEPRVHAVLHWILVKFETVIVPRATILWGVHVQPQLDRIYDKLFRNREARQVAAKAVSEGKTTQILLSSHASSQYTEVHSPTPEPTVDPLSIFEDDPEGEDDDDGTDDEEEEETVSSTRVLPIVQDERPTLNRPVQVDANLENWRTQIRNAGVEAEELFLEAIQEIFTTEQERETSITKNMVLELNNTVQGEIASLENTIIYLAKKGRASEQDDPRIKELHKKVVESGKKIRNHAVEIRSQPHKINLTLGRTYLKAIKERFEGKVMERRAIAWKTMDEVVGEAQIEIGNEWMWLADITYKDWQQFHGLQDMANTIKQRIHASGSGDHFDAMASIQDSAEQDINTVAKDAATKLSELKDIGREKILLGDSSENFGKGWVPVGVKLAAGDVKSKVSEAVHGTETPTGIVDQVLEGVGKATDAAASAADTAVTKISQAIYGIPQGVVESLVSQASKAVVGEDPPIQSQIISSAQDILSSAGDLAADAASKISTAVLGTPQGVGESLASQISTAILGTPQGVAESVVSQVTSVANDAYNSASSYASSVVDDLPSYTDVVDKVKDTASSASSIADEAFSSASSAASSAASAASEGIIGAKDQAQKVFHAPEPGVGEKIASQASEAIYGTESNLAEKATDAAKTIVDSISSKASEVVHGTESGVGEKIVSQASEAIYGTKPNLAEQVTDAAKNVVDSISSQVSEAVHGTEPGVGEKVSSVASSVASEASKVIVGTEQGTMEKATSAVGSVVEEVGSKVAEAAEGASSVASSVASEVTEAYGAATSKVWENTK